MEPSRRPAAIAVAGLIFAIVNGSSGISSPRRSAESARLQAGDRARPRVEVLPNLDDDDRDGRPDFAAEGPRHAADDDLAPIPIDLRIPLPSRSAVRVEVPEPWVPLVRVYIGAGAATFRPVTGSVPILPEDVRDGRISLAVEVGDFADAGRPRDFDLAVLLETAPGAPTSREVVPCRVAPFLLSCCLDPAEAVHVVRTKSTEAFVRDLEPAVRAAGSVLTPFESPGLADHDIWMQDATEIGRAVAGDRSMPVALHGNRGRPLDDLFFSRFLAPGAGVVRKGGYRGRSAEWIDWFGNLEASPPTSARGRDFPRGRVYAGTQGVRAMHPEVVAFLEAQGEQGPLLWLDTSWLIIGHVDETVSWVPSQTGRPYRCLLPSPRLALEILDAAERDAPGGVVNRGTRREGDAPGEYERPVAEVLKDRAFTAEQVLVQEKIDGIRSVVRDELGVADADIIEIPVLFGSSMERFPGRHDAWTTNMVNSLLIGDTLVVPDPHGPLVGGRDVLLGAVEDRLGPLGVKVVPVDNFFPYHRGAGEIHCGTNVTRRTR